MAKQKILIIEDDADTRMGLSVRLRASGYETLQAADGNGGFMAAQRDAPDVILLDLGLPAGDGFTVLERLKGSTRTEAIPVIVLSARDPTVHKPKALQMGAVAFLQKPAENEDLLAEIRKHLTEDTAAPVVTGKKKILIIEDDADTRHGLSLRLRAAGYETAFAADGMTAIRAVNHEKPDAILLDLGLPAGDGFSVLDRLQKNALFSSIPVIVLTAREPGEAADRARALGSKFFFQKPLDNELLLSTIREVLEG